MKSEEKITIGDWVSSNIKSAHVFKKYGIDFCCGGGVTLEKACHLRSINLNELLQELENLEHSSIPSQNYNLWELDFLMDYIIQNHHSYVRKNLTLIGEYATKVSKVHGAVYPEVVQINKLFQQVAEELLAHMAKEELVLFPYIKKCVVAERTQSPIPIPPFRKVLHPIQMMQNEHDHAGSTFKEIARLSNQYLPPTGACNTFRALYSLLDEFEQDLHIHVHLENNILFPKAILLESKMNQVAQT